MTALGSIVRGTVAAAALAMACSAQAANTTLLVCELRGAQETPPAPSPARGCGRFLIDTNANTITYRIVYGGLVGLETAAHFHVGAAGVAGPVKIALPAGMPKVGVVTYFEADQADILAGRWYTNIHTTVAPAGEIRGQMNSMCAILDGVQEAPANATPSQGWATFRIDTCTNKLDYHIVVESLTAAETAAHIHGMSMHGVASGVIHPLPLGALKVGTWSYNESQELDILAGRTYVNVHTTAFPGGEIRGQITPNVEPMDAMQEVPPNPTTGVGCAFIAIDQAAGVPNLSYYIRYAGTTGPETASHIHGFSAPGVNSGVQIALPGGPVKLGGWAYGPVARANVINGLTYINVHTAAFPGGEIRGQINFPPKRCIGDTTCNGFVNVDDLLVVINGWGPCPANPAPCPGDNNHDGFVNVDDLLGVINSWGKCP